MAADTKKEEETPIISADKHDQQQQEERKIPVFTVLKNNSILKNIFLLDNPPSSSSTRNQEVEEILVVGRHPDCNITLEHPSISRYHLRIISRPSSQNLSVIDLSSVHGTWVSGNKIEPGVRVQLNEGDTVQLGGSSRVYRLHWVPLSRAYDLDDPFVPAVDMSVPIRESQEEKTLEDENYLNVETNQVESVADDLEGLDALFSNGSMKPSVKKLSPSAPLMPEDLISAYCDQEVADKCLCNNQCIQTEILSVLPRPLLELSVLGEAENQQFDGENQIPPRVVSRFSETEILQSPSKSSELNVKLLEGFESSFSDEGIENFCSSRSNHEQRVISSLDCQPLATGSVTSSVPCSIVISETKDEKCSDKENQNFSSTAFSAQDTARNVKIISEQNLTLPGKLNVLLSDEGYSVSELYEVAENLNSPRNEHEGKEIQELWPERLQMISLNSTLHGDSFLRETELGKRDKEDRTSKSLNSGESLTKRMGSPPIRSERTSNLPSIWLRRGKPSSVQVQTSKTEGKSAGINTDAEVEKLSHENIKDKHISRALFAAVDGDEKETYTPDKENFPPENLLLKTIKKKVKVEETNQSTPNRFFSLENAVSPNINQDEDTFTSSDKENQSPKILQERKSVRPASRNKPRLGVEVKTERNRVPFQSLRVSSASTRSRTSVNYSHIEKQTAGEENKRWIMVADTNCFLHKESRKALQLLQGLKGTQLVIPRIVIRELDCMKRRASLFRRTTDVSSALQWIDDCMANTKWWIHVQRSVEEGRLIAPTPPASAASQFSEESWGSPFSSVPLSARGNLQVIVSPTAEDHILDCALLFRKTINAGRIVLLSGDITLKIKAMAEGLMCEAAEEFRNSLVNPFSERFLWDESSPRGPSWSCFDDVVLREKYYSGPLKKPSKSGDGLKGLKLILLHNSHYRQISSAR